MSVVSSKRVWKIKMNNKRLRSVLRSARACKGLSLRDIEKKSRGAISNPCICQIETGVNKTPMPSTLRTLSDILELDYLELMVLAGHLRKSDLNNSSRFYR